MFGNSFPNSNNSNLKITSPSDDNYNCISWAYGINNCRMWPNLSGYYWPSSVPSALNINSFIELFKQIKYEICQNGYLEDKYEKICIYEKNEIPQHAARQLPNGNWTSKLGRFQDVEHSELALSNGEYGNISIYMKRLNQ
jgi:hypothetical protein